MQGGVPYRLMRRVAAVNNASIGGGGGGGLRERVEWRAGAGEGDVLGSVRNSVARSLLKDGTFVLWRNREMGTQSFRVENDTLDDNDVDCGARFVTLDPDLNSRDARTAALNKSMQKLIEKKVVTGVRNEYYPVLKRWGEDPFCLIERSAAPLFGTKSYGVHVNGYVEDDGELKLWVATRSKTKQTYPGKLDHMVAGGQPFGIEPAENVVKECMEEASVPAELARTAKSVGAVSYTNVLDDGVGLKRDVLFCYDLRVPVNFTPVAADGEVEHFELWPIQRVLDTLCEDNDLFKPNVTLVIIDFLIRHGLIRPEEPGFLDLLMSLRQGDCS